MLRGSHQSNSFYNQNKFFISGVKRSSLLLFGISSVCLRVDIKMYFSAFPEEFPVLRCCFFKLFLKKSHFPRGVFFPCYVKFVLTSLLEVVGVQPWTVLFYVPLDDQEHLCYILGQLFAEKRAEGDTKGDRREKMLLWPRTEGRLLECSVLTQTNSEVNPMWPLIWDDSFAETRLKSQVLM